MGSDSDQPDDVGSDRHAKSWSEYGHGGKYTTSGKRHKNIIYSSRGFSSKGQKLEKSKKRKFNEIKHELKELDGIPNPSPDERKLLKKLQKEFPKQWVAVREEQSKDAELKRKVMESMMARQVEELVENRRVLENLEEERKEKEKEDKIRSINEQRHRIHLPPLTEEEKDELPTFFRTRAGWTRRHCTPEPTADQPKPSLMERLFGKKKS